MGLQPLAQGMSMRANQSAGLRSCCARALFSFLPRVIALAVMARADAQTVTVPEEFGKLVTATSQVKGLNTGLVGDEVNLYSGSLGLTQTDVSVPGNSGLAVELTRRLSAGQGVDGFGDSSGTGISPFPVFTECFRRGASGRSVFRPYMASVVPAMKLLWMLSVSRGAIFQQPSTGRGLSSTCPGKETRNF